MSELQTTTPIPAKVWVPDLVSKVWPATIVLITGLTILLGLVYERSYARALGIRDMGIIAPKQDLVTDGIAVLLQLIGPVLLLSAFIGVIFNLTPILPQNRIVLFPAKIYWRLQAKLIGVYQSQAGAFALIFFFTSMSLCSNFVGSEFTEWARALPFKDPPKLGTLAADLLLDETGSVAGVVGFGCAIYVGSKLLTALLAVRRLRRNRFRWVLLAWCLLALFSDIVYYAVFEGVIATVRPFPIVLFSGDSENSSSQAMKLLVAADGKQAILFSASIRPADPNQRVAFLIRRKEGDFFGIAGHGSVYHLAYHTSYQVQQKRGKDGK